MTHNVIYCVWCLEAIAISIPGTVSHSKYTRNNGDKPCPFRGMFVRKGLLFTYPMHSSNFWGSVFYSGQLGIKENLHANMSRAELYNALRKHYDS